MNRWGAVLGIGAALAAAILIGWLTVTDRSPPRLILAESPPEMKESRNVPEPASRSFPHPEPYLEPAESRSDVELKAESTGIILTEKDQHLALFLSRLDERDFQSVISLVNTSARVEALRATVPLLRERATAARAPLSEMWRPIAMEKLKAGEGETLTEPPKANPDEISLASSSMDPQTKAMTRRVVRLRRGDDPRFDEAWAKRDIALKQVRDDARALIDSWSR